MSSLFTANRKSLTLAAACLISSAAFAAPFTTTGAAGAVDDDDLADISTFSGTAQVNFGSPIGSASVRYNIPSLKGFAGSKSPRLRVRFKDSGGDESVTVSLRQLNAATGSITTFGALDSDSFAGTTSYQTQQVCFRLVEWDFDEGPFYLEALFSKTVVGGTPAIQSITVEPDGCGGP